MERRGPAVCSGSNKKGGKGELLSGRSFEYLFWSGQTLGRGEGAAAFDACPGPQSLRLEAVE